MKGRALALFFHLLSALALGACGGGGSDGAASSPPPTGSNPPPTTPGPPDPAPPSQSTAPQISIARAFPALSFTSPVALMQAPNDTSRWYVVEQGGVVRSFPNDPTASSASVFVDLSARVISGGEQGLLGMAFHPDFPANPHVYLSYTASAGGAAVSRISELTLLPGGTSLDAASERVLMSVRQPEANHNGGNIRFGPDNDLYIGFGDGGGANDQHGSIGNAQLLTTVLGKILRIDVDGSSGSAPYRVPIDNPFAGNPTCELNGTGAMNCPEIFASGFRNPWRWSFDRSGGTLWVADVGQGAREEVDRVLIGRNYGWRCVEGTRATGLECGANPDPQPPVAEYGHDLGNAITGGFVYRGSASPALAGRYVFGDFGSGRVWSIAADSAPTLTMTSAGALDSHLSISTFGEGADGEIYILDYAGGGIYHVRAN